MHMAIQRTMCTVFGTPSWLHICVPMFSGDFLSLNICSRYSPAVLPQRRPSRQSMDFVKLIKQTPHKEFFLPESCAEVSMPFLCLNAVSVGLVWTRLVAPGANAALRERKIHWCNSFSCIGTRNWCLAVIPMPPQPLLQCLTRAMDIWDTVDGSEQYLLQAFCLKSARIFTQVRKGEQTFANESPTVPSLDKASEWVFKSDLEDLATGQATSSLFVAKC